jgi:hypothetical protein
MRLLRIGWKPAIFAVVAWACFAMTLDACGRSGGPTEYRIGLWFAPALALALFATLWLSVLVLCHFTPLSALVSGFAEGMCFTFGSLLGSLALSALMRERSNDLLLQAALGVVLSLLLALGLVVLGLIGRRVPWLATRITGAYEALARVVSPAVIAVALYGLLLVLGMHAFPKQSTTLFVPGMRKSAGAAELALAVKDADYLTAVTTFSKVRAVTDGVTGACWLWIATAIVRRRRHTGAGDGPAPL